MQGQLRVNIENISPELDGGRYAIKRIAGERVTMEADIFSDGHDNINARIAYKHAASTDWNFTSMELLYNDRWKGSFVVEAMGFWDFKIQAWVDHAMTWQHDLKKRVKGKQPVAVELLIGANHLEKILSGATKREKIEIAKVISLLRDEKKYDKAVEEALSEKVAEWIRKYPDDKIITEYPADGKVFADRKKAGFSTWYELFPRSTATELGKHGTFNDVEKVLPRLEEMGIDVLYLPPIHPIGASNRKGKNNAAVAKKGEYGSPWAIGSSEGGHKSILKHFGTLEDFQKLVKKAEYHGIEIALDYALQCSPDHPYVKQHPEWFTWRPDGTVQYAENPPKKYQDVLPINFETGDWKNLWNELKSIVEFWIENGVKIFRVDNPHTKPFPFWEWLIREIKTEHPEVLFLAEAFTRPKVMQLLGKIGFSQSYTYYSWRNTKQEIIQYMNELTKTEMSDYFRPNFWPNTPDINPYMLQSGLESQFITRLFMAATLSSSYGFYGPVYEMMVHDALPGKEEYLNSEKYEVKWWDWQATNKLKELIAIVNEARYENEALQQTNNIQFCETSNDKLIAFFKQNDHGTNSMLMVVNLDPYYKQGGYVQVPIGRFGKSDYIAYVVHDLINDVSYTWSREWNFVELDPYVMPCHLFRIEEV
ncbi:MAG: alpha-1,4-glucan--maltose-1-phosphate maltosyltransferase [Chitinophagales bacterium]